MMEWQKQQKHSDDVKAATEAAGCVSTKEGFVRKWDGKRVLEELAARGHDTTAYRACRCATSPPAGKEDDSGLLT